MAENIDTSTNPIKSEEAKKPKDKKDNSIPVKKESIEEFLFRKEKENPKRHVSERLKKVFIAILARNKGNLEKSWSELWA